MSKQTVEDLMNEIVALDTEVPIFKLILEKASYNVGFYVHVDFREHGQNIGNISRRADTAIEALKMVKAGLLEKFMSREYYMEIARHE